MQDIFFFPHKRKSCLSQFISKIQPPKAELNTFCWTEKSCDLFPDFMMILFSDCVILLLLHITMFMIPEVESNQVHLVKYNFKVLW